MILVDTNLLVRLAQPGHSQQQPAWQAIRRLADQDGETIAIVPQNLYELYVVCSRPLRSNGLGMSSEEARAEIDNAQALFELLPENSNVCSTWESLIAKYAIVGKPAHDARLVAMMIVHGVPRLLTFNDGDFRRFTEIVVLNPFDMLGITRVT